jgi:hypothetical protein
MSLSVDTIQNNSICQNSSAFNVNSGFQLLFKHCTICNIDHLSMILVVLEDGPIKVPKQLQHHLLAEGTLLNFWS